MEKFSKSVCIPLPEEFQGITLSQHNPVASFCNSFHATVCHVCKDRPTDVDGRSVLKVCSSCKLVSYCSIDHQKQHWPFHRDFCRALSVLLKKMGISKLFGESMRSQSALEWNTIRHSLGIACRMELKRCMRTDEIQMLHFPRVCNVCHDPSPKILTDCENCLSVSYCSGEHQRSDHERHSRDCSAMKQILDIDQHKIDSSCNIFEVPVPNCIEMVQDENDLYNMLVEFSNLLQSYAFRNPMKYIIHTEIVSSPMTVVFAACKLQLKRSQNLSIHVVGVNIFEAAYISAWEVMFHWLDSLRKIRLLMVGPENKMDYLNYSFQVCTDCQSKGATIELSHTTDYYTDSVLNGLEVQYSPADMIVAFNCGFSEFAGSESDLWGPSLPVMVGSGAPVIFTSYTTSEAVNDIRALQIACNNDIRVLLNGEENLFRSCCPHRNWECDEEGKASQVFYKNNFLSIVQKKT